MRLVHYRPKEKSKGTTHGRRVAIVDNPGRKWLRIVINDAHLTVTRVLVDGEFDKKSRRVVKEQGFMEDIESLPRRRLTPLQSTAKRWLKNAVSITDEAREILERAAQ